MNFGIALALLRAGKRVARRGWNGKGMYIYLVGPGRYEPSTEAALAIALHEPDELVPYRPYIAMKTVDNDVVPWVASQTDLLGDDWELAQGERIDFNTIEEIADEGANELAVSSEDGDELMIVIDLSSYLSSHLHP